MHKISNNKKAGTAGKQIPYAPVVLVPGKWGIFLKEQDYKMMVAQALNACVYAGELVVTGYLLEQDRLFVLFEKKQQRLDLYPFFEKIRLGIVQYAEKLERDGNPLPQEVLTAIPESCNDLFKQNSMHDDHLAQLVTGQKRKPGFAETPQQAADSRRVRNSLFCSAIDYAGGIGPVALKIIK